jgi:hypothetical protein
MQEMSRNIFLIARENALSFESPQESKMENRRVLKPAKKNKGLLTSLAQTIGSTLGTVVAKTDLLSKPAPRRKAGRKSRLLARKSRKKNKS